MHGIIDYIGSIMCIFVYYICSLHYSSPYMTFLPGLVSLMRTKRIAVTVNEIGSLILCATFLNFGGRMYSLPTAVQPCEKKKGEQVCLESFMFANAQWYRVRKNSKLETI